MMSVYERMREIGTLKALGMTNKQVFYNFLIEGAILGAIGGVIGASLGYAIIAILSVTGINLEAVMGTMDLPMELVIRPRLHIMQPIVAIFISTLIPALASIIPAKHANKYTPTEALRN